MPVSFSLSWCVSSNESLSSYPWFPDGLLSDLALYWEFFFPGIPVNKTQSSFGLAPFFIPHFVHKRQSVSLPLLSMKMRFCLVLAYPSMLALGWYLLPFVFKTLKSFLVSYSNLFDGSRFQETYISPLTTLWCLSASGENHIPDLLLTGYTDSSLKKNLYSKDKNKIKKIENIFFTVSFLNAFCPFILVELPYQYVINWVALTSILLS